MIAPGSGFTGSFLKKRSNSAYFRLKKNRLFRKIPCGFKQQARARHTGEKCGLVLAFPDVYALVELKLYRPSFDKSNGD